MRARRLQFAILPKALLAKSHEKRSLRVSEALVDTAALDVAGVYAYLKTRPDGLTTEEADARLAEHGQNILAKDQRPGILSLVWRAVRNPLVILLAVLATVSIATGDPRAATMMLLMIVLSVGLRLIQEAKASSAAAKLKAMISVKATVLRGGAAQEIAVSHLVPGDVVQLAAGDMIPGDVRVVQAKDLFVIQGSLTGESFPVEKFVVEKKNDTSSPLELTSIAFLGTSVGSGAATAVVVATGKDTYLGGMAESLQEQEPPTAFDRGIARFTMLMLGFMAVMVPLVFVINGVTKGIVGRGLLLRGGGGRRPHARNAADDRDDLPLQGCHRDGQEAGHRQADQRDPEPRRDERPVHGQDRHAHARRDHSRETLRRRAARERRRARPRVHQ